MKVFTTISILLLAVTNIDCHREREDYVTNTQLGRRYKLKYKAETWASASEICKQEGGKLAVPKTEDEFNAIQKVVRNMWFPDIQGWTGSRYLVWVGISNQGNYSVWQNVDGENIEDTAFSSFAMGNGGKNSNDPRDPHCVAIDAVNLLRDFWCHKKQPYLCEYALNYVENEQ